MDAIQQLADEFRTRKAANPSSPWRRFDEERTADAKADTPTQAGGQAMTGKGTQVIIAGFAHRNAHGDRRTGAVSYILRT